MPLPEVASRIAYAANSSSNVFASFRSRVSNPSVNHPYTGANSSRACCVLPWSRHTRFYASVESLGHDRAKARIVAASGEDNSFLPLPQPRLVLRA